MQLTNLVKLDLSRQYVVRLPSKFSNLQKLQYLDLGESGIGFLYQTEFPNFSSFFQLSHLDISNSYTEFLLCSNYSSITNAQNVTYFKASGLLAPCKWAFPRLLKCAKLETLDISNWILSNTSLLYSWDIEEMCNDSQLEECRSLPTSFDNTRHLEWINISNLHVCSSDNNCSINHPLSDAEYTAITNFWNAQNFSCLNSTEFLCRRNDSI